MENKKTGRSILYLATIFFLYGMAQAVQEYRVLLLSNQGLSAAECGYVIASASLLVAIARPVSGAIADKLRSRRGIIISICFLWLAVMLTLVFFSQVRIASFVLCAGIIPIMGICNNTAYGMVEAEGVIASAQNGKIDYSLIRLCLSIGYCGINFIYTPVVNKFGDRAPFLITAFLVLIILLTICLNRNFGRGDIGGKKEKEKLNFSLIFKNYFLMTFVISSFILSLGGNTNSYIVYLLREVGISEAAVGIASGIRVVGEILMMVCIPLIKRKLSIPLLQIVACAFQIVQMLICIFCRVPFVLVGAIAFSGMAGGITLSTTVVYLKMMAPEGLNTTTMSLSAITQNLGGVISSLAGGVIIAQLGIFMLYKIALFFLILWIIIYVGTWCIGQFALKLEPPVPMFRKKL